MARIQFYTRRGCHLCEIMLEQLLPLLQGRAEIDIRDIDSNASWLEKFDIRVPVIELDGRTISGYPLDRDAVRRCLAEIPEKSGEIGILRR